METITINGSKQKHEIQEIRPISDHVLMVHLADQIPDNEIPDEWGDIAVYTEGGYQCANLPGYSTVYRSEGKTIYLSNDGSVYVPPDDPVEILPQEPYIPTVAELQAAKKMEVSAACQRAIYNGVSVTLADGSVEHFALTVEDQLNLFGKQSQLMSGMEYLEYHADGQPCRYYSAADMQAIIEAAMWHVSYHTTYCNALHMWIAACETAEQVQEIYYGADVPEQYQSEVLQSYLTQIMEMAGVVDVSSE